MLLLVSSPILVGTPAAGHAGQGAPQIFPEMSPLSDQPVSSARTLWLLTHPKRAAELLRSGTFVREPGDKQPRVKVILRRKPTEPGVMFRLQLELGGDGKSRCGAVGASENGKATPRGGDPADRRPWAERPKEPRCGAPGARGERPARLDVFFKPQQRRYADWATETAACRLAHHLRVRVAPCTDRRISYQTLAKATAQLPEDHRRRLIWQGEGTSRHLFGFFRLWAPHYRAQLGTFVPVGERLLALAERISVENRGEFLQRPVLQAISDLIVFDFLIYNNDRRNNLGSIRDADRIYLYPIDFGDGLSRSPRGKVFYRRLFGRLGLFRRSLIESIRALKPATLRRLFSYKGGLLARPSAIKWVMAHRADILARVAALEAAKGDKVLFN